jgi:Holliday junction resolvase-like predicted endonuclease
MTNKQVVIKASGEKEAFSEQKLRNSLHRSGAPAPLVDQVVKAMWDEMFDGISTKKIYQLAFRLLRRYERIHAARYSLKDAIMKMGPSGYPFEHFVGKLLQTKGYDVEVGVFVQGKCVQHEIDVVATKAGKTIMVECKYHNDRGKLSNVHVPLYINSRFKDVFEVWAKQAEHKHTIFEGWVVTNTRFSSDATDYGLCAGLKLLGWDFPKNAGLKEMVEQAGFFPITVITALSQKQKQALMDKELVLCHDLIENENLVSVILHDRRKTDAVLKEARDLCGE